MLRQAIAAFLGLFLAFTEVFNFRDLEAPALNVEYYPQVRKKNNVRMIYVPAMRGRKLQSGRMP